MANASGPTSQDTRIVLAPIRWETYESLARDLVDNPIRMTYDCGTLEITQHPHRHESFKKRCTRLLDVLTEELDIPVRSGGSATFQRADLEKALEPDACYWIRNEPLVGLKPDIDLTVDPAPDLAIEIDLGHSSVNRKGIYAALGVAELWAFDGDTLSVHRLQPDGTYMIQEQSAIFPFLPLTEFARFLHLFASEGETRVARAFRSWVRDEIAPRYQA